MNILSQNYNNLLKNLILNIFSDNLKNKLFSLDGNNNVFNYITLLSNLDESLNEIAKISLVNIFEELDRTFSNSFERKRKYDIKSHHSRTILTIFGEITFNRTFYKSKLNNNLYCYVDRYLGLHKYDYFDPYLKSMVIDYAANNSFSDTAKYINNLISNRITIKEKIKYLSRQTIRNIILTSKLSEIANKSKENTPDELYIIADEKWIHTQNNNKQAVMEKSCVVFENIKNHKLYNKQIFASIDNSFLDKSIDYIYNNYDINKIKTIYVMGDGAKWIKNLKYEYKIDSKINTIFCLDKFHFKQAIHHLCMNKEIEKIAVNYVLNNNKDEFIKLIDNLLISTPHRQETILSKKQYILNNWKNIKNLYYYKLSCPMESQISHNIAALFTARPKGYSISMINKLTTIRLLYKNNYNIKELYLNNFNSDKVLKINKEKLNFNIFNKNKLNSNILSIIDEPTYPIPFDSSYPYKRTVF